MSDKTPSAGESVLAAAAGQTQQPTPPATPAATPTPPANPPADQQQTGQTGQSGDTGEQTGESGEQRVPLDRFQTVTSENKELREKVAAYEQEKAERERAAMSELERAQAEAADEKKKREEAESKALQLERGGYLRSAAAAAGFADPEDAVALIGLDKITDLLEAQKAVKDLAEKKPHLIQSGTPGPRAIGNPLPTPGSGSGSGGESGDEKRQMGRDILGLLTGRK